MKLIDMLLRYLFGRSDVAAHRRATRERYVATERLIRDNRAIVDDLRRMEEEIRGR